MSSGRGECISSTRRSHWHASSTSPWWSWSANPTASAVWRELWRYQSGKTKAHVFLKVVFCFVWCIISCFGMLRLYDYMFALSYRQLIYAFYLCVAVIYFCVLLYSMLLFSHLSLSSHSAPRSRRSRVRRHPPSSRSLSLRVRMGPSARSLYTRSLFLPSAQSRKAPLLPETRFVKATLQISLIVSHFVTKYIDTTYQK